MKVSEVIHIVLKGGIDLDKTEQSGQCFRWRYVEEGVYDIPAFGQLIRARENWVGLEIEVLSETKGSDEELWNRYFDTAVNYEKIRKMPDKNDKFLRSAAKNGEGIRIIRQDPFETLITFIISQRKSIPAIKTSVEKLCRAVGRKIPGTEVYDFPTPQEIIQLDSTTLADCGLGYRASYIHATAAAFANGNMDIEKLSGMNDEELVDSLMTLKGVGIKVASCTALFGFHRLDFFPIDVWIQRALDAYYNGTFPLEKYHPYNGIMQQYIFAVRDTIDY